MAFEEHYRRAEQAMAADNYEYAVALLMDILNQDPKQRRARSLLRSSEMKQHQLKGGRGSGLRGWFGGGASVAKLAISKDAVKNVGACEEYLKGDPVNTTVLTKLAENLQSAGLLDQAIDTYEFIRQVDNTHQATLRKLVDIYQTMKDYTKAQICCEELARLNPYDQQIASLLKNISATGHMQASQIETVGASADMVRDKKKAEELEKDQRIVRTEEEIKAALAEAVQAIKANPKDRINYIKLGDLLAMQNNYRAALEAYNTALKILDDFPLREKIGNLRLRYADAQVEAVELQAAKDPDNAVLAAKVKSLRTQRAEMQRKEFEMRVRQQPTNTAYRYELGRALFDLNQLDRAVHEFQQSIGDPKLKVRTQHYLGRCFLAKNIPNLAINQFTRAIEGIIGMTDLAKDILYDLGLAYEGMGNLAKAVETYEKIFETDIGYRDVSKKVSEIRRKMTS